ncbi:MAG: amidohydrolase family protein [Alphaproteobacteria bacterium]|nr:amidohydrolase family protein [Alphaproteobacteria bacterium]
MEISENVKVIALAGGSLIDGTGADPLPNSVVLVEGARIQRVGREGEFEIPSSALVIDTTGTTVMPGLIDLHVHLRSGPSDRMRLGSGDVPTHLDMALTLIGIKAYARARQTMRMGFTTLRDVGDVGNMAVSLRDAIDSGTVEGPRILASGPNLTATGGTADYIPDWLVRTDTETRVVDGIEGVRRAVRRNIKHKTDWVKFFATGTFGEGGDQDFTDDEMRAMVDEAHAKGKFVCAHACFAKGTLAAVRAGVDSVEHGSQLTDEIIDLMLQKQTTLVPTIYIFHAILHRGRQSGMGNAAISTAQRIFDRHIESFRKAMAAGVKIAMGSDCGNAVTEHGTNAIELELMVKHGMSPMEAILSATRDAAATLRMSDRIGAVKENLLADIIAVHGNPLADIRILQDKLNIGLVMKHGAAFHCNLPARGEAF